MADVLSNITPEKQKQFNETIRQMNGFDDEFLNALLQENKEAAQYLLRIVLRIPDLVVIGKYETQEYIKNIYGRSIRLDCYAESLGKRFDVEIQRKDKGAGAHRARYNSSLMDARIPIKGKDYDYDDLPDTYVIFITEHDLYGEGAPYYEIERYVNGNKLFNDGAHILYVNGEYEKNDPIGRLMHDLHCSRPEDMHESPLRDRARELKETEEGVREMSERLQTIHDEGFREGEAKGVSDNKKTTALIMIADGESDEKIIRYTGLLQSEIDYLRKQNLS